MKIKFLRAVDNRELKYSTIYVKDITGVKTNDEDESILEISIGKSTTVCIDFKISGDNNEDTYRELPIDRARIARSLVQQMIDSYKLYRNLNKERTEWSNAGFTFRIERGAGYIQKTGEEEEG